MSSAARPPPASTASSRPWWRRGTSSAPDAPSVASMAQSALETTLGGLCVPLGHGCRPPQPPMSGLEPRSGGRMTRRQRERRAYQLTVATGVTGLAGAVGIVLAIVGVIGAGFPILLLIVAAVLGLALRRALGR